MSEDQPEAEIWRGSPRVLNPDPLQINYIVVHGDDRLEEMSPLQGFGRSWDSTLWALPLLARLPASVIERTLPLDGLIAMRMGGMAQLAWRPLMASALDRVGLDDIGFLVVLLSGSDAVAKRVDAWCALQPRPTLHVHRTGFVADPQPIEDAVRDHCREVLAAHGDRLSPPRREAAQRGIEGWKPREPIAVDLPAWGHNATSPNEIVLARAERQLVPSEGFIGASEEEYDRVVIESAEAVMAARAEAGLRQFNRLYVPRPAIVLQEPALYRFAYPRMGRATGEDRAGLRAVRMLQTQRGLFREIDEPLFEALTQDERARFVVSARQGELATQTAGVALMAAQTCSAVLRLRPAVNHVFPALLRFAGNVRAQRYDARFKTPRLFADLQNALADAVGAARIEFIERHGGPIKIVSDAPLELLPIGNLPLALRYEVSRVNATPGNLMMGELVPRAPLTLAPAQLNRVLVVSAFDDDDPLRNMMTRALERLGPQIRGAVAVRHVRVGSVEELVDALNGADETILVFDGHGTGDDGSGIGGIVVGGEVVNVWGLRGTIRVPPIVILSACDTQGIDAPSHVTVANGFIAAGARTVVATMLPIGGIEGAVFLARFLYRLAEFLPAALKAHERALSWGEIVSGMLRMVLASETIAGMLNEASGAAAQAAEIQMAANADINMGNPEWYDALLSRIAQAVGGEIGDVARKARSIMARSEAIRYVQIGFPEDIVVDDGSVFGRFFPPDIHEQLGIA
jgi:hypothetical protein